MTHLGSSKDFSRAQALKLVASGVKAIMKGYKGNTQFLLEISAGAGNVIGDTFEELEYIIKNSDDRIGVRRYIECAAGATMCFKGARSSITKPVNNELTTCYKLMKLAR